MSLPTPSRRSGEAAGPPAEREVLRIVDRYRPAVLEELRSLLAGRALPPFTLMRYHLGWEDRHGRPVEGRGGKLLRPALCLLCCEAAGGDWRRAVPAAAALELLHNFTLVHDDVEDSSARRHGRETLWSVWGAAQAINVGDGMFALAHLALLRLSEHGHDASRVARTVGLLDEAALHLCEGQHRDLLSAQASEPTRDDYLTMVEGKTAALLAASAATGGLLGSDDDEAVAALYEFGRRLGLAFQVRDDVLGVWGDPGVTGKPAGDDLRAGKRSYPVVVAFERASPAQAEQLRSLLGPRLSDDDVRHACALLEELGARQESEQAAREYAEAAVRSLEGVSLRPERGRELELLARFAAERAS